MKVIWSKKVDEILCVGRWMGDIGDFNWALTRDQAFTAIDQLNNAGIGILGGSVFEQRGARLAYNYDHWHCDPKEEESDSDFVSRSILAAQEYINAYPQNNDKQYFFEIVPETKKRIKPKAR